jgi:hypothetical protein
VVAEQCNKSLLGISFILTLFFELFEETNENVGYIPLNYMSFTFIPWIMLNLPIPYAMQKINTVCS